MNGYINGLKAAWSNKAVQNTLAGFGGFLAGRVYPKVKQIAGKGMKALRNKWQNKNQPPAAPADT